MYLFASVPGKPRFTDEGSTSSGVPRSISRSCYKPLSLLSESDSNSLTDVLMLVVLCFGIVCCSVLVSLHMRVQYSVPLFVNGSSDRSTLMLSHTLCSVLDGAYMLANGRWPL